MRVIIIFLILVSGIFAQTFIIPDLERDDFKSLKSWWSLNIWGLNHTYQTPGGYLIINLIDPVDGLPGGPLPLSSAGMENIGFSTAYQAHIYGKDDIVDATIRVKTLNPIEPGSRGWGLWKSEPMPIDVNQETWFIEQEADPGYSWAAEENWWRARITRGLQNEVSADLTISNQDWHTYRIIRHAREYYELYVDDDPTPVVHAIPTDIGGILNEDFGFNCWNDNLTYHATQNAHSGNDTVEVYYNGWLGTSSFVVDFIEIRYGGYVPGYSVAPDGVIKLREVIDEIDNGVTDGLWKGPYSFNSSGENSIIIVTAKAEELDTYDDDDDLKMVLDSKDFGYNNARSWDGNVDQGSPKTIIIDTILSAGLHNLSFYSESTPVLYDVTVLGSLGGGIVLNETVNESAPQGSENLLWKTYNFSCNAGQVAVYISGSADEEPDWNHRNNVDPDGIFADIDSTDDDELRIELDGNNYGWESDSSFVGNTLFSGSKTILINQTISNGSHTLRLYANESPTVYNVLVYAENPVPSAIASNETPKTFQLYPNYPNPFNPQTKIKFDLAAPSFVKVTISDVQGRCIKTIQDQGFPAGTFELKWDGRDNFGNNAASGIYFLTMRAGDHTFIQKMTLIR